jgi:hypothetical protein
VRSEVWTVWGARHVCLHIEKGEGGRGVQRTESKFEGRTERYVEGGKYRDTFISQFNNSYVFPPLERHICLSLSIVVENRRMMFG